MADIQDPLVEKSGAGDPTVDLTGEKEDSSITAGSVPEVAQGEAEATPTQQQEVQTEATPTQHQQESREQEQTDTACNKLPSQEETEKVALEGQGEGGWTGGGILERMREHNLLLVCHKELSRLKESIFAKVVGRSLQGAMRWYMYITPLGYMFLS